MSKAEESNEVLCSVLIELKAVLDGMQSNNHIVDNDNIALIKSLVDKPQHNDHGFDSDGKYSVKALMNKPYKSNLEQVFDKLDKAKARIDKCNEYMYYAIAQNDLYAVKCLIENGANNYRYKDIILLCAKYGHVKVLKHLLSNGINIHDYLEEIHNICISHNNLEMLSYLDYEFHTAIQSILSK